MIDLEQGAVAKVVDAAAVALLWKVARGHASDAERAAVAAFPSQLHLPTQMHLHKDADGTVLSLAGTWTRENLRDYLHSSPGFSLPSGRARPPWLCALGFDAAFPVARPTVFAWMEEPLRHFPFSAADEMIFARDEDYLAEQGAWFARAATLSQSHERDRNSALSAATFVEAWRHSSSLDALAKLNAFELEMRARKIGMIAGDGFARRLGWTQNLIGLDAMRAFNRVLAGWSVATLMPRPFRTGILDRALASPGLCAAFLAASAATPQLDRAAAQRAKTPAALPTDGVRYVHPAAGSAADIPLHRLVKNLHGTPVFAPIRGNEARRCEMIIAVRVERTSRPAMFPHPSHLALNREQPSMDSIILRVGERPDDGDPSDSLVDAYFLSDGRDGESLRDDATAQASGLLRVLENLRRAVAD